ncbi:MAG: L,D-transpeptidase family protein [Chloroflexi bacterium]|nr:L,D-transpeptidase family protein [Chloroflexota bacterium]
MNEAFIQSRKFIAAAREALKNGNMAEARQLAERAAELAPQSEDPWLLLAAVASPRESVEYIRRALELNPQSPRAKKGMEWALKRLGDSPAAAAPQRKARQEIKPKPPGKKPRKAGKPRLALPLLLILTGCAVFAFAAWSAATSPVLASIINLSNPPQPQTRPFAQVNIPKPAPKVEASVPTSSSPPPESAAEPTPAIVLPVETEEIPPTAEAVVEILPTPTEEVVFTPTTIPVEETASQPAAVLAEIIPDTPTPEFVAPTAAPSVPPKMAGGTRWIDIDLSQQRLYAYEGDALVNSFVVSTGTWQTPTVTGNFKIWIKVRSQAMSGPGYYLPDVPYVMYFYKDYGIHGAYWHNNFGTPMSHGCVNMTIPDAEWLYNFASVGTTVNVHN